MNKAYLSLVLLLSASCMLASNEEQIQVQESTEQVVAPAQAGEEEMAAIEEVAQEDESEKKDVQAAEGQEPETVTAEETIEEITQPAAMPETEATPA